MKEKINILNEMYKVVAMGIEGIEMVKAKIEDNVLAKEVLDSKKKYQAYKLNIVALLNKFSEDPKEVSELTKKMNEIYTDLKLINNDDKKIVKMLIEGTNKGIIKLQEIKNRKDINDNEIQNLNNELLELLEFQVNAWKVYL